MLTAPPQAGFRILILPESAPTNDVGLSLSNTDLISTGRALL